MHLHPGNIHRTARQPSKLNFIAAKSLPAKPIERELIESIGAKPPPLAINLRHGGAGNPESIASGKLLQQP